MSEDDLAALQLNLTPGIGPRLQQLLLGRFGTAREVFNASGKELLNVLGIGPKISAAISQYRTFDQARVEVAKAKEYGIQLLLRESPEYPSVLKEIPDPPMLLYVKGEIRPADALAVGIVGSRHCTHYGRSQAEKLARGLSRAGVTVISGLARGIDAAAHQGAIDGPGRTLAVCATGLLKLYPPEHKALADEVIRNGAMISESPLERGPNKGLFPQRNRIISGLSHGVIIVEASRKSGALHTARHAMEQGRDVFVVPGRLDSPASDGCHDLIRDGATLIRNVDDILESLGPMMEPVQTKAEHVVYTPRELNLSTQEQEILQLIDTASTSIDSVLDRASIESSRVLSTLTVLEMKRLIRRLPGSNVERTGH